MKADKDDTTPPSGDDFLIKRLKLKSPYDIFNAMARFTRMFIGGKFPETKYKSLIFGLNAMLGAFKIMAQEGNEDKKSPNPFGPIVKMVTDENGEVCFNE